VAAADLVAAIEAIAEELRVADVQLEAATGPGFHPVRAAHVLVDGALVGIVGEVGAEVVSALDLPAPVHAFELDVHALRAGRSAPRSSRVISRFPASTIDLAFVVDDTEPAGAILRTLETAAGEMCEHVELFDVFRSDALGDGRVSLAFSLRFRSPDHTLTDEEVAASRRRAIDAVIGAHRAELRG
jgi:phenylalanyl-tRNA synthetase beta chain